MAQTDRSKDTSEYYDEAFNKIHYSGAIGIYSGILHRGLEKNTKPFYSRVLELGAGSGEHLQFVQHNFDEYICLDLELPDKLPIRLGVKFVQGDAEKLTYQEGEFDRVLNVCLLHHVSSAEKVLREMRRVTKTGGQINIFLPCDPGMVYRWIRHWTTHKKTSKVMKKPMHFVKYMWAIEHKGHFLAVKSLITEIFKEDRVRVKRYPFQFFSWNANLFVHYSIIKNS